MVRAKVTGVNAIPNPERNPAERALGGTITGTAPVLT
jgi:hypothetical protein